MSPDWDAIRASVFWADDERSAGRLTAYEGMYIAVLGTEIIDSDRDEDELGRRLESAAGTLPLNRVAVRYVPRPEDWNWK
jgi:hypothetical protein